MIFDFTEKLANNILDSVENAVDVTTDLACLETPKRRQVARLLADGLEIAAISVATGVAEDVIAQIADGDS